MVISCVGPAEVPLQLPLKNGMCSGGQQVGGHKRPLSEPVPTWGVSQKASPERAAAPETCPEGCSAQRTARKEARLGVWVYVCVGAGGVVGAGEEHTQSFLSPPFCLFEHAPRTGLGRIGSLRLGGMKRRIVPRRVWLPARNQSSEGKEEKGRAGGGWGRRPGEIAGGRREGERPGSSRSQASGQQAGLGRSCSRVHRCGA